MTALLSRLVDAIDATNNAIGRTAAWLTAAMVVMTCAVVVLRYAFGIGATALQEGVIYLHATVFLLAAAWTLNGDGHVRVDIVYRRAPAAARHWVNLLGSVGLLLPFAVFIGAASLGYVIDAWAQLEASSQPGGLPFVYLLKSLILVFAAQLAAAALARSLEAGLALAGSDD